MCFSTILSRVLHKYFLYIPPMPLSNDPSVNKVLSCLVSYLSKMIALHQIVANCYNTLTVLTMRWRIFLHDM